MKKICLFAPTGSGKTTIAQQIVKKYDAELLKIAQPLYKIQDFFYEMIGKEISGQDGEFLQFIGYKLEREQPGWLALNFLNRVKQSNKILIINDDCRPNSYSYLKNDGFIFIRIYTKPKKIIERLRKDHTPIDSHHPIEQGFEEFQTDYTVENNSTISETFKSICSILDSLKL